MDPKNERTVVSAMIAHKVLLSGGAPGVTMRLGEWPAETLEAVRAKQQGSDGDAAGAGIAEEQCRAGAARRQKPSASDWKAEASKVLKGSRLAQHQALPTG